MILVENNINRYLESSYYINWNNTDIVDKAKQLLISNDEIATVKNTYYFVRDIIKHSWDIQDKRVTACATDVLKEGVGICWGKANLFCALLRANHIPSGICYQRLTLGDTPESGYCIHALNAIYISSLEKWIRLDARGNKDGINAEFNLEEEQLAFPVREEYGEIDYPQIYAEPLEITMNILEDNDDAIYMYLHCLPENI